jgi:hypothetical protein
MVLERISWTGHVAHRILVGKADEKRPLGRPRHSREDSIKMNRREIGWGGID